MHIALTFIITQTSMVPDVQVQTGGRFQCIKPQCWHLWRLLTGCQEQKLTRGCYPHTHPSVVATQHPLISAKMSKTKFNNSHAISDLTKSCTFRRIISPQTKRFVFADIHRNVGTMRCVSQNGAERGQCCCCCCVLSSGTTYSFRRMGPPPPPPLSDADRFSFKWQQRRGEEKQPGWTCSAAPERPEAEVVLSAFLPRSPAGARPQRAATRTNQRGRLQEVSLRKKVDNDTKNKTKKD